MYPVYRTLYRCKTFAVDYRDHPWRKQHPTKHCLRIMLFQIFRVLCHSASKYKNKWCQGKLNRNRFILSCSAVLDLGKSPLWNWFFPLPRSRRQWRHIFHRFCRSLQHVDNKIANDNVVWKPSPRHAWRDRQAAVRVAPSELRVKNFLFVCTRSTVSCVVLSIVPCTKHIAVASRYWW